MAVSWIQAHQWLSGAVTAAIKQSTNDFPFQSDTLTLPSHFLMQKSRDSSVGIVMGYGLDDTIPGGGWEILSSPPHPERLWGPPSLLSNGYQGLFPCG
jgi:hypothetical protein